VASSSPFLTLRNTFKACGTLLPVSRRRASDIRGGCEKIDLSFWTPNSLAIGEELRGEVSEWSADG